MIKFAISSDLHLNHYEPEDVQIIINKLIEASKVSDITIIAGDIFDNLQKPEIVRMLEDLLFWKIENPVIYVLGNHCSWGGKISDAVKSMKDNCSANVLDNEMIDSDIENENCNIYGGTMWFPELPKMEKWKENWADFRFVKDNSEIFKQHNDFKSKLLNFKEFTHVDVVVSHHLPSFKSVTPVYATAATNMFFVSDQEDLISAVKPKLWVHGHTHSPFDYKIGRTRVVCNPLGYPAEYSFEKWQPKIVGV